MNCNKKKFKNTYILLIINKIILIYRFNSWNYIK